MAKLLKIPFFILFAGFLVTLGYTQPAAAQKKEKQKVEVYFTSKMKLSDLEKIRASMAKKNIHIKYLETRFNSQGYLTHLMFRVDCRDGYKGEAGSSIITEKRQFGFFRDYRKNATVPFGVGNI